MSPDDAGALRQAARWIAGPVTADAGEIVRTWGPRSARFGFWLRTPDRWFWLGRTVEAAVRHGHESRADTQAWREHQET